MRDLLELYQGSGSATRLAELHELVLPTLDELTAKKGYERALFIQVDTRRGRLESAVGPNLPDDLVELLNAGIDEKDPILESLRVARPLRVDDTLRDSRITDSTRATYGRFDMVAFAVVPLLPAS